MPGGGNLCSGLGGMPGGGWFILGGMIPPGAILTGTETGGIPGR